MPNIIFHELLQNTNHEWLENQEIVDHVINYIKSYVTSLNRMTNFLSDEKLEKYKTNIIKDASDLFKQLTMHPCNLNTKEILNIIDTKTLNVKNGIT